ncbi:Transposase, Mutator family [Corynebacterium mustelae]|uniref:Transposase, Mutator family n=1 Tax=Corynebacterium mustelae TaxID=571915 RepID=A0A0G3GZE9_9CORY|nr:Transposase, Mutator family [Corynebacterium mustelae]
MVWHNRQLDEFYPVIFLDAIRIKVLRRGSGSHYIRLPWVVGVDMDGITTHVLGIWIVQRRRRILT